MAGIPSPATLTTAGTRQQVSPSTTYLVNGVVVPSLRYCNRVSIRLADTSKIGYIGYQAPIGVSNAVSSASYNALLDSTTPAVTIGPFGDGNGVDLGNTYFDGNTSAMLFIISPVQV